MKKCYGIVMPEIRNFMRSSERSIIAIFLCTALLFAVKVNAQSINEVKVSVNVDQASLKETLNSIQRSSGFQFIYNDDLIGKQKKVTINVKDQPLSNVLNNLLTRIGLTFLQQNKKIIISEKQSTPSTSRQQNVSITGTVVDEKNEVLPGVTVTLIEAGRTVATNNDGKFEFRAPLGTYSIMARMIGFTVKTVTNVKVEQGQATKLTIALVPSEGRLNEVVVTALGIKREEKALGYATSTVSSEQLNNAISNNWTDALSGKVAGLNLLRSNGGPAGSNRIILRGENSLSGTTEALIVVDGVVVSSSSGRATGNGISYNDPSGSAPTDYGTSINDINPEDIESVSVLKGPGATALYGARGAGGAILITTKMANQNKKGIGITFSSNTAIETTSRWPDYQYEYGQGDTGTDYYSYGNTVDGNNLAATSNAYGPKFDGQSFFQYDKNTQVGGTARTPWIAHPNNRKDLFVMGKTFTNNLSIEGGNNQSTIRLSYSNLHNNWIIPNTGYDRNTISLGVTHKVTNKLSLTGKANFINRSSDNLPGLGYSNQTIMYSIIRMVPNADIEDFKQYWKTGQEGVLQNRPYSQAGDNPYLAAYEMLNKTNRNSVTGFVQANYQFTKELNLMMRATLDMSYDERSQQRPKNTRQYQDGMYRTQNIFNREINTDFLLKYKKDISKLISSDISLGGSILKNNYRKDETRAERLFTPGIYSFANSINLPLSYPYSSRFGVTSMYALATFGYSNYLYLDVTGRQDWSSTLFSESGRVQGFFYPSVNLSFVASDRFNLPTAFSYLKFRGSIARVGSGGTTPYLTSYVYQSETNFPSGLTNPTSISNLNLKPESTQSVEFGMDAKFFGGRLGSDISVYQSNTKDQILSVPVDRASGYNAAVLNSGEVRNRGIEVALTGIPVRKGKFTWTVNSTFTANRNKILSLADSVETLQLQKGPGSRGSVEARPGGSMGDLYGMGYDRSPDGQIVYLNGIPEKSLTAKYLTNVYPSFKTSVGNEFRHGAFRLNILFDAQFGGHAYSHTYANNAATGQLKSTLPGRYSGIIGDGVIRNADGTYRKNDVAAEDVWNYYAEHFTPDNVESNIFSTDFIKLREARLEYTFPTSLAKKLGLQRASIGVYGRDLLIISNWPSFDPEFGTNNNGLIQTGFEVGQFPATRTLGINLNVKF